nr:hypothetical protein CFP56_59660 [Quercus suber]
MRPDRQSAKMSNGDGPAAAASRNLCQFCANINFQDIYDGREYEHMPDATRLLLSGETCDLCSLICSTIEQNVGHDCKSASDFWLDEPITLQKPRIYLDDDDDDDDNTNDSDAHPKADEVGPMTEIEVSIPVQGGLDVTRLGIRRLPASDRPGESDLNEEPFIAVSVDIHHSASPAAFRRMRHWLRDCSSGHTKCNKQHDSQPKVSLPTRLLRIGQHDGDPCQLILTTGMDVEYVALSHCWGKHQLLRTLKANMDDHFVGIALEKLPKTFREAMVVTKHLGIEYIWIDSLCIVQDDNEDWKFEALRMGNVYSGAKITIAATGAVDSSEGLFMERPALAPPVAIPYRGISMELYQHPDEKHGAIDWSALDSRAWITQEFLLSKRIIHFTRAQLIWSCSTINETENGDPVYEFERESLRRMLSSGTTSNASEIEQSFYDDWNQIATRYCSRQLTYFSDKPIAIQGLADTLAQSRGLVYKHGIWMQPSVDTINISQLFWYCKFSALFLESVSIEAVRAQEFLRRPLCLQSLPSWSWTSMIGDMAFHHAAGTALQITSPVTLEHDATLVLRTHLMSVTPQRAPDIVVNQANELLPLNFFSRAALAAGTMLLPSGLHYFGSFDEPGGWGSFILPPTPEHQVYCCAMSANPADAQGKSDGVNVLLLQRKSATDGVFVMVGVGEIMDAETLLAQPRVDIRVE